MLTRLESGEKRIGDVDVDVVEEVENRLESGIPNEVRRSEIRDAVREGVVPSSYAAPILLLVPTPGIPSEGETAPKGASSCR